MATNIFGKLGLKGRKLCHITMQSSCLTRDPITRKFSGFRQIGVLNEDLMLGKPLNITFEDARTSDGGAPVMKVELLDDTQSAELVLRLTTKTGGVCILEEVE